MNQKKTIKTQIKEIEALMKIVAKQKKDDWKNWQKVLNRWSVAKKLLQEDNK